ncbi:MAG: peptidoglycan-binding domain-containing protein [Nakamurella sp.]
MNKLGTKLTIIAIGGALLTGTAITSAAAQALPAGVAATATAPMASAMTTASIPDDHSDAARAALLRTLPTVQQGSSGGEVLALQIGLRNRGAKYLLGTGYFGPLTTKAVKEFQRSRGLAVDGVVGPRTWDALIQRATGAPYALANPQLRPGQSWVQATPGDHGYLRLGLHRLHDLTEWSPAEVGTPVVFEDWEVAAVRELQRRSGLTASGILGARTTRVILLISAVTGGYGN